MNVSVIICSVNRAAILHDTVLSLTKQSHKPAEILIVSPDEQHVLPTTLELAGVRFVSGPLGLPAQRNAGLDQISAECDLIAFFDDDIELASSYLEEMALLFAGRQEILIASGRLLHDGGRGTIITREQASVLCEHYEQNKKLGPGTYIPKTSAYGCNMMVRRSAAENVRFDEGLPLYAWLEDRDYSHRLTRQKHPPVEFSGAVAVHLGSRSGRIGGVRMGFSTIVNPLYLWKKNRAFSLPYIFAQYWSRCLIGNVLGLLTRDSEYDRAGLLKGNFLGLLHLLSGKCDPAHILKLDGNSVGRLPQNENSKREVVAPAA